MAQECTKTILSSFSPGTDRLLPKAALPVTDTPENSAPHRGGWKQHIYHWISKPSIEVFIALAMVIGLAFFPTALSSLGASNELTNRTLAVTEDHIVLSGEIPKFDWKNPEAVSVQWYLYGMGRYKLQLPEVSPGSYVPPNVAMDIYIENASQPVFSYDPAEVLHIAELDVEGFISIPSVNSFRTASNTLSCELRDYVPRDCYSLSVSGFAIEKETNNSIPLFLELSNSGTGDFDAVSFMLQSSTNFTRIVDGQLTTTEVDSSMIFSNITHSKRARALTYFLFTINWLLALCSIIIAALSFRRRERAKGSIALAPIILFFAIPNIRGLYPSAPALGTLIDLVGFFPQMISVAFCIAVTLAGFATRHDNKEARPAIGPEGPQTGAPFGSA